MKVKMFFASTELIEPQVNKWLESMSEKIEINHICQSQSGQDLHYISISVWYTHVPDQKGAPLL